MRAFLGLDPAALGQLQPLGGNAYAQLGAYTIIFWAPAGQPFVFDNANNRFASGSIVSIHVKTGGVNGQLIFTADSAGDPPELFDAPTFWDLLRDRADGLPGASTAFAGLWEDRAFTYNGADGRDYMGGSSFADTYYDVGAEDEVWAKGGSDTIHVYGDVKTIDGGFGGNEDDLVIFHASSIPQYIEDVRRFEIQNTVTAVVDLSLLLTAPNSVTITTDFGATVIGTRFIDDIQGNNGADILHGGDGEDKLKGGEGNDDLRGGEKNDDLKGEGGDDTLRGDKGADTIDGGEGQDTAIYDSYKSSYYIKRIVGTNDVAVLAKTWQVRDSEGWNQSSYDTLTDVENIKFAGETVGVDVQLALSWITEAADYMRTGSTAGVAQWAEYVRALDAPKCLAVARGISGVLRAGSNIADIDRLILDVQASQDPPKSLFIGTISLLIGNLASCIGAAIGSSLGAGTLVSVPAALVGAVGGKLIYDKVLKDRAELFLADVYEQYVPQSQSLSETSPESEFNASPASESNGRIDFDEDYYLGSHPEVRQLIEQGQFPSAYAHFVTTGIDLGYQPNATQSITRDQLAFNYSDPFALHYSAPFSVAIGQYAGDGVSSTEQALVGLINSGRTAAPLLDLDATLSTLAHRKAVDLVQNWPVNAVSEAQYQPDSSWAALWSTSQSFRDAFQAALENVIGASASDSAFKVLVGVSQNGSAAEALALFNQKSDSGALTDAQFDTVGVAEYGGIWVIVLADRAAGYVPIAPGADTLSNFVVYGTEGADLLYAGTHTITAYGGEWIDQLIGGIGNDTLDGGAGADTMSGGLGNDTYFIDAGADTVVENLNEGTDTVYSTAHLVLADNIENLTLVGGDLQGYGNALNNILTGTSGANVLDGRGGVDTMTGGLGNDVYFVDSGIDAVVENADEGFDTVFSTDHLVLGDNVENLSLIGGDLQGYGNSLDNVLTGTAGANLLDGRGGNDQMFGGLGNDLYFVDSGLDAVFENADEGFDTVHSTDHLVLGDNVENLTLIGGDLQGYGNALNNVLTGTDGANLLDGRGGNDQMFGGLGNDVYFVDSGTDAVFEDLNEGLDIVFSTDHLVLGDNVEYLRLMGSADLQGYGNALDNILYGNDGANLLDGRGGADALEGGGGNDNFMFNAGQANGDVVVDFAGHGAGAGDFLLFVGYGAGATFAQIESTNQWQITYNGGLSQEIITFANSATIDPSDYAFI